MKRVERKKRWNIFVVSSSIYFSINIFLTLLFVIKICLINELSTELNRDLDGEHHLIHALVLYIWGNWIPVRRLSSSFDWVFVLGVIIKINWSRFCLTMFYCYMASFIHDIENHREGGGGARDRKTTFLEDARYEGGSLVKLTS